MSDPSDIVSWLTPAAVSGLVLKEGVAWFFRKREKDEDETEATLKAINQKLDTIVNALHAHDTLNALLEARVEDLGREVKDLRVARHELVQQVASNKARIELLAEKVRDLAGDTNPRGHSR